MKLICCDNIVIGSLSPVSTPVPGSPVPAMSLSGQPAARKPGEPVYDISLNLFSNGSTYTLVAGCSNSAHPAARPLCKDINR